jgi:Holliday junction resolvase RusA-like endonuclease
MLDLRVAAYYSIPVSASRKKKAAMESGEIRPTKKPDADNILKVVADALNKIAYHDDAQVVDARVQKSYSRDPRLEVSIEDVECIF